MTRPNPQPGEIYRHFKGSYYRILATSLDTETERPLVVYQDLEKSDRAWSRPLEMFLETCTDKNGSTVLRFRGPLTPF